MGSETPLNAADPGVVGGVTNHVPRTEKVVEDLEVVIISGEVPKREFVRSTCLDLQVVGVEWMLRLSLTVAGDVGALGDVRIGGAPDVVKRVPIDRDGACLPGSLLRQNLRQREGHE